MTIAIARDPIDLVEMLAKRDIVLTPFDYKVFGLLSCSARCLHRATAPAPRPFRLTLGVSRYMMGII